MNCWICGAHLNHKDKISFRATCETCNGDLHCCKNCKFYSPGRPNDCAVPGTDFIADRSKNNFCEEFSILGRGPAQNKPEAKKRFDDLFKEH